MAEKKMADLMTIASTACKIYYSVLLNYLYLMLKMNKNFYLFLNSWAGGIQQILQSDWFRERAEFSHPDRHSGRNPSSWSIFVNELAEIVNFSPVR